MKRVVIIGAGGYAKVIAETMGLFEHTEVIGFMDDQVEKGTIIWGQAKVLGPIHEMLHFSDQCDAFIIGIGNNDVRRAIAEQYSGKIRFETLVHPSANVSKSAHLSEGAVVLAGAIVNSNSRIGRHSIINSNVVVDHDCRIGEFVHLAIGTLVGSNSVISDSVKTQIGQLFPVFSTN